MPMLVLPLLTIAFAADPSPIAPDSAVASDPSTESQDAKPSRKPVKPRTLQFEIGTRIRYLSMPKGVMGLFFTRTKDIDPRVTEAFGDNPEHAELPLIQGMSYGMEIGFKKGSGRGIVWVDYVASGVKQGYFDDRDDEYDDGDYVAPHPNLGVAMFGVNYAYEVPFLRPERTKGVFGIGLDLGAGLGLGILTGGIDRWQQGDDRTPSYTYYLAGAPPVSDKDVPRFFPIIDMNLGLKLNFADRVMLRLEGGLHTALYYGAALDFAF